MKTATMALTEMQIRDAGISAGLLAQLVGISASSLRDALRGDSYLGGEKEAKVQETASLVLRYQQALWPLSLPAGVQDVEKLLNSGVEPERVKELVAAIFGQ